jgi:hypothetical protein
MNWAIVALARLATLGAVRISRALESPQDREARLRRESRKGVVSLIVAVLYSVLFWYLWAGWFTPWNFPSFLLGVFVWLVSLALVPVFAWALYPLILLMLLVVAGAAVAELYVHFFR